MPRETEFDFGLQRILIANLGLCLGLGSSETPDKEDNHDSEDILPDSRSNNELRTMLDNISVNNLPGYGIVRIRQFLVSRTEIGIGSNGTTVYDGLYAGRSVAVKRLVQGHVSIIEREIQALIKCDNENIIRYYGWDMDENFVYIALERCTCSLDDLFQALNTSNDSVSSTSYENKSKLDSLRITMQNVNLWRPDGYPSTLLLKLMRGMVSGLVHLHKLKIIHRDLKPQNVLITEHDILCAKLADMGISRCLRGDKSSLTNPTSRCGSSGWRAPEQLLNERQTRAMDMFSLGCILFFCITRGRHPFGGCHERDMNILNDKMDLSLVKVIPEAHDLLSSLLNRDHDLRPKASEVLHHPLFWSSETRLSFFHDFNDVLKEQNHMTPDLLKALESKAPLIFNGNWDSKLDPILMADVKSSKGRRGYDYSLVRDLVRLVRNKKEHYRELPKQVKEVLGPYPEGYDDYFRKRFPSLLIESYGVALQYCEDNHPNFSKATKTMCTLCHKV